MVVGGGDRYDSREANGNSVVLRMSQVGNPEDDANCFVVGGEADRFYDSSVRVNRNRVTLLRTTVYGNVMGGVARLLQ